MSPANHHTLNFYSREKFMIFSFTEGKFYFSSEFLSGDFAFQQ